MNVKNPQGRYPPRRHKHKNTSNTRANFSVHRAVLPSGKTPPNTQTRPHNQQNGPLAPQGEHFIDCAEEFRQHEPHNNHQLLGSTEDGTNKGFQPQQFFGTTPPYRNEQTLRLFYNNCNGLEGTKTINSLMKLKARKRQEEHLGNLTTDSKLDVILHKVLEWQTNIICLAETGVPWETHTTKRAFHSIVKSHDPRMSMSTSSSSTPVISHYKPGGTVTMVDGTWSSTLVDRGQDSHEMGRWSYITITGRHGKFLTVVTGYRNSKRSVKHSGSTTAVAQQDSILRRAGRNVGTEKAFIQDIEKFLAAQLQEGKYIVLFLDANEEYHEGSAIKLMADRLGLKNAMQEIYGNFPPSNPTSHRTIDHVLCSDTVLHSITNIAMPPYNLSMGDHRGFIIDLDVKTLLKTSEKEMNHTSARRLDTRHVKAVKKYKQKLKKGLKDHNVAKRMETLKAMVKSHSKG